MKGKISISDFIHQVKRELIEAQGRSGEPFYSLSEVTLEISFVLEAKAGAGMKLYVLDLNGETKAEQTHKVSLKLHPIVSEEAANAEQAGGKAVKHTSGGGGGGGTRARVDYAPLE